MYLTMSDFRGLGHLGATAFEQQQQLRREAYAAEKEAKATGNMAKYWEAADKRKQADKMTGAVWQETYGTTSEARGEPKGVTNAADVPVLGPLIDSLWEGAKGLVTAAGDILSAPVRAAGTMIEAAGGDRELGQSLQRPGEALARENETFKETFGISTPATDYGKGRAAFDQRVAQAKAQQEAREARAKADQLAREAKAKIAEARRRSEEAQAKIARSRAENERRAAEAEAKATAVARAQETAARQQMAHDTSGQGYRTWQSYAAAAERREQEAARREEARLRRVAKAQARKNRVRDQQAADEARRREEQAARDARLQEQRRRAEEERIAREFEAYRRAQEEALRTRPGAPLDTSPAQPSPGAGYAMQIMAPVSRQATQAQQARHGVASGAPGSAAGRWVGRLGRIG